MTLTLLLQLTDEEQLYAETLPAERTPVAEQEAPAAPPEEAPAAAWPEEAEVNG